jgi:arsenate reductase
VAGCSAGAIIANLMFSKPAVSISAHHRATPAHFLSEIVATLGLILVIFALARSGRGRSAPAAVGAYIGAAYFFTSSTSFANPAIAIGRMLSNTFAGITPSSVPAFIAAEVIGGVLAWAVVKVLYPGGGGRGGHPSSPARWGAGARALAIAPTFVINAVTYRPRREPDAHHRHRR